MAIVYKVVLEQEWRAAERKGEFHGSAIDLRDGYIHLSSGEQLEQTVAMHFDDRDDLILLALEVSHLGEALKWEASRGGALFPHYYGSLPLDRVAWVRPFSARDLQTLRSLIVGSC